MGKDPRAAGDSHVKSVHKALLQSLKSISIISYPLTTRETVSYIRGIFPNIISVASKFESSNPDHIQDLTLHLSDGSSIPLNLFRIKKGSRIQPKNPGAKSFLAKYFLSDFMQKVFNDEFERYYHDFLKELVEHKEGTHYITDKRELKKLIKNYYPSFTADINIYREKFLFNLREICFNLLKEYFNIKNVGFSHAFKFFFMVDDFNIITSYGKAENDVKVERFNPTIPTFENIELYKTGKNAVGIKFGEIALTLRFKFESSPTSSVKLATSYHEFPNKSEIELANFKTLKNMEKLIEMHEYIETPNSSNAIGKCHEAYAYYYFLKEFPDVIQVDPNQCIKLMGTYAPSVKPLTLKKLYNSTSTIVQVITNKLKQKYNKYVIETIELIPDAYIGDRLDTGDLQLVIKVNNDIFVENISLKALAKRNSKITTKNPGIGTILGPTYFNIGNMESIVREVKSLYNAGELDHRDSLERLATEMGIKLSGANQDNLRRGIGNLLGEAMMAITIYGDGTSFCKEHTEINSDVKVLVNVPSNIQNTLVWNNELETLSLRVKFSKGHSHGWSSIKLTSEYQLANS